MDFNLIAEVSGVKNEKIQDVLQRSYDLGFNCVAINTIINSSVLSGKNISIPEPKFISFDGKFGRKFRILNRLTAIIEDPIHAHHLLKSPITKRYDILAIQPVNEKILQHVSTLDIDIVCLDLSEDFGYTLKKTHVGPILMKGMCFEIAYSQCLKSQMCRRTIISNSQHLVEVCKFKNIIISSSAQTPLDLRSPEDVVNFSMLFGFKRNGGVSAVKETGNIVISHAQTRTNSGCGFMSITDIQKIPKQQGWILKICKVPSASKAASFSNKRHLEVSDNSNENKKKRKE